MEWNYLKKSDVRLWKVIPFFILGKECDSK